MGIRPDAAKALLLEHIRVCFDCCHVSVEYEDPRVALERYQRAGIRIGRVQFSSALDVPWPADSAEAARIARRLTPFADPVYLHQVVERRGAHQRQFPDLDDALRATSEAGATALAHPLPRPALHRRVRRARVNAA